MDRYIVAPASLHAARPVFLPGASAGSHRLQPLPPCGTAAGRRSDGAELDIFTAERYFNAADVVNCSDAAVPTALPADEPPQLAVDAASQSGRTAVSSEASWNSRSGLLSSNCQSAAAGKLKGYGGNGVAAVSDQYHHGGKRPGSGLRWWLFGRDCPCAGRKAVTVDVVASEPRSPTTPRIHARFDASSAMQESAIFKAKELPPPTPSEEPDKVKITPGSCAFPLPANKSIFAAAPSKGGGASFAAFPPDIGCRVVSSGGFTFPVLGPAKVVISTVDEPPRESLEVFRPIDEDSEVLADPPPALAVARGGFPRAPAVVTAMEEDAMSDTSTDLFDLESFAASSSYPTTYRGRSSRRNSVDDDLAYSAAAAEPALSEASVVWSVVTAEGGAFDAASAANFSSAASACCVDEFRFPPPEAAGSGHDGFTAAMFRSAGRKKGGAGGGFLNSCRCEKAVNVGPAPVRVVRPPAGPELAVKAGGHAMGPASSGAARHHPGRVHMPVRT